MNRTAGLLALVIACAAVPALAQSPTTGPQNCAALRNLQLPGVAISEVTAEWIPAGPSAPPGAPTELPAHCRLQAMLERRTGVDGQQYGIGFALSLPAAWNRRFLFQGGGAYNGVVNPPIGRFPGSINELSGLARGFAVASTDSGLRVPRALAACQTNLASAAPRDRSPAPRPARSAAPVSARAAPRAR